MFISSPNTMRAKWQLEQIKSGNRDGKLLLKNFIDHELKEKLITKTTAKDIIDEATKPESNIYKFAELLYEGENIKLFKEAIKLQGKSPGTKESGLFYKFIYKNRNNLLQAKPKIKAFLLAKKGENIDDDEVEQDDRGSRRMKNADIIEKLKSKRLSNRLKAFMALVAWEYIAINPEKKLQVKSKLKAALALPKTDEREISYPEEFTQKDDGDPIIRTKEDWDHNNPISKAQKEAFGELTYKLVTKPPKSNKYLQYMLNSYLLEHGQKSRRKEVYYKSLGSEIDAKIDNVKAGDTFELKNYICNRNPLSFDPDTLKNKPYQYRFRFRFKAEDFVMTDDNCVYTILPPNTTVKVIEVEDKFIAGKTKIKLVTCTIIKQKIPASPTDEELSEIIESTYTEAQASQEKTWNKILDHPDEKFEKNKNKYYLDFQKFNKYIRLLGYLQREKLSDRELGALNTYTALYQNNKEDMKIIDGIFEKVEPLAEPLTVFRAMDKDEMNAILRSYKSKKKFQNFVSYAKDGGNHFLSTSVNPRIAIIYMKATHNPKGKGLLKLLIPAGNKVVIPELTTDSRTSGSEVMLQRQKLKIKINKVTEKNGYSFIEATVI